MFSLAITAIRASAFSTTQSEVGETHSSCSSEARPKNAACCPARATWTTGLPPAFQGLLVDGLKQRLGGRPALDRA